MTDPLSAQSLPVPLAPGGVAALLCAATRVPVARLLAPLLHTAFALAVFVIGLGFLRTGGIAPRHGLQQES
jgi:ABC-type Fe3+ transport system permease subunit